MAGTPLQNRDLLLQPGCGGGRGSIVVDLSGMKSEVTQVEAEPRIRNQILADALNKAASQPREHS